MIILQAHNRNEYRTQRLVLQHALWVVGSKKSIDRIMPDLPPIGNQVDTSEQKRQAQIEKEARMDLAFYKANQKERDGDKESQS